MHYSVSHNFIPMHFLCFLPVLDLKLDNLTTLEVEPHCCPLHQFILLTKEPICEFFAKKKLRIGGVVFLSWPFWFLIFFKNNFFCAIFIQISHKLWGTKDGTKFWWLPLSPAKSLGVKNYETHCKSLNHKGFVSLRNFLDLKQQVGNWKTFPRLGFCD